MENLERFRFRATDVNGRLFYGNLALLDKKLYEATAGAYISNKAGCPFAYQVRPETIQQCTGVKDKNGKLVYEGDIVRLTRKRGRGKTGTIVYDAYSMRYRVMVNENDYRFTDYAYNPPNQRLEIIGNIHETPGLMGDS